MQPIFPFSYWVSKPASWCGTCSENSRSCWLLANAITAIWAKGMTSFAIASRPFPCFLCNCDSIWGRKMEVPARNRRRRRRRRRRKADVFECSPENNQLSLKWGSQPSGSKGIGLEQLLHGWPVTNGAQLNSWTAEDDFRRRLNDLWSCDSAAEINRRLSDLTWLVSRLNTERPSLHKEK